VTKTVTLADGSTTQAWVPQVYVRVQEADITVQGSALSAGRILSLYAQDQIQLQAAQNSASQQSSNSSKSSSLGVSFGTSGLGVTASTSRGRGNADGSDLTYTHTQIKAGEQIFLTSGGDTSVKGAVVQAPRIDAQVGGNLLIQSLQDTSTYTSQQKSSGGSITVGTAGVSGSVNAGKSHINSQYTSVTEQSGLRAGDGGFNVNVQGNTRLVGGAITSTQAAIDHGKNTFQTAGQSAQQAINSGTLTVSDLHNQASYSASSSSVNLGTGFSPQGKLTPQGTSAGFGKDSGQASSVTQSAISGMAGNTAARTGDAETGINKIFDADRVQKEINAQTQITQLFGQQAPKAAAEFAQNRAKALRAEGNEDEAKQWDEGGAYRVALHTTIGALSGGSSGAAGGFASASTAPLLNAFQDQLTQNLKDAGANDKVAQSAGQLIASLTVAGIGAAASGGSVAGAAVAFNIDANL
jgi:filamentous hemagglutinin